MNLLIKNNPSLSQHEEWASYLKDAAQILINENRIMDAAIYLKECQQWAVKRGDGVCLTCGGFFEFMIYLMEHCTQSQIKQVRYLLMEYFPHMHKKWFFRNALMKKYNRMMNRSISCYGKENYYSSGH